MMLQTQTWIKIEFMPLWEVVSFGSEIAMDLTIIDFDLWPLNRKKNFDIDDDG